MTRAKALLEMLMLNLRELLLLFYFVLGILVGFGAFAHLGNGTDVDLVWSMYGQGK